MSYVYWELALRLAAKFLVGGQSQYQQDYRGHLSDSRYSLGKNRPIVALGLFLDPDSIPRLNPIDLFGFFGLASAGPDDQHQW